MLTTGSGAPRFDARRIAPELAAYAAELGTADLTDLATTRRDATVTDVPWDPAVRITTRTVPGPPGAPPVAVRLYDARRSPSLSGGVVHVHGGAFISGDPDFEHRRSLAFARDGNCLVASVDYRLAPENPYPAAIEDCSAVLDWMIASAPLLGLDPARVGVAGSSAGGCLAAGVALRRRDADLVPAAFQILVYPVLDCRASSASVAQFFDAPGFCGRNVAQMWSAYLRGGAPDPYASPALARELGGLPQTFISVAELDPLRDEGIEYATRLLAAGVPVELRVFPGTWHGFDLVAPESAIARSFNGAEVEALRRMLASPAIR